MKLPGEIQENILLIDKPTGITSFDVIRQLRRMTGIRKFGHAGTLDPAASGLMIVAANSGTKQLQYFTALDKEYETEILLGEARSTGDMDGEVVSSTVVPQGAITHEAVCGTLESLIGTVRLPVSAYSAIKKNGVPMYKIARAAARAGGVVEEVPYRDMRVYEAELLGCTECLIDNQPRVVLRVRFFVGSGTYIRSLAEAVGQSLGYPAVVCSLRRTKIGNFTVKAAYPLVR